MPTIKFNKKKFLTNYFEEFRSLIIPDDKTFEKLIKVSELMIKTHVSKKKIMIAGNGGSAAISSHFSVDLTKNAKVRSINFNEADLITCFANDFGYEDWLSNAIKFYGDKNDLLFLVSVSGKSSNIVNAAKKAKKFGVKKIITFTGCEQNNPLKALGDINFWVNSKSYNLVENNHQFLLLSLVDLIIGKSEYKPN
ncbi:SIS domain-containing protein [Candidatus Pelagibacter sp.]|nr:SIS domain-containing protein [Candidatus Pelagibacter sp.]|tara:strand:+ start:5707 stop:6291 length:585 start_codon:yes stop_codon:yes gene_type:complete